MQTASAAPRGPAREVVGRWQRGAPLLAGLFAAGLIAALATGCGDLARSEHPLFPPGEVTAEADPAGVPVDSLTFEVPPPPFRDPDVFPCSECHDNKDLKANPTRRTLHMAHEDIVLHHDEEHRWCLDCHDAQNRDKLRLANGTLVDFKESFRLCGQCHGDKYREWRAGVHGRRIGSWNGKKEYLLCVKCHWSHAPRFAGVLPEPPPTDPGRIR